jgi:hypothetical protein
VLQNSLAYVATAWSTVSCSPSQARSTRRNASKQNSVFKRRWNSISKARCCARFLRSSAARIHFRLPFCRARRRCRFEAYGWEDVAVLALREGSPGFGRHVHRACAHSHAARTLAHKLAAAQLKLAQSVRLLQVLSLVYSLKLTKARTSIRDIYYMHPNLFQSQRNSDEAIHLISTKLFRCPRSALNLTCASRGKMFGAVAYYNADGAYVDCMTLKVPIDLSTDLQLADCPKNRAGQRREHLGLARGVDRSLSFATGYQARASAGQATLSGISGTANAILVVEKECAFQRCVGSNRLSLIPNQGQFGFRRLHLRRCVG